MERIFRNYISNKIKRYDLNTDDVLEQVPGIKERTCVYCGLDNLLIESCDSNNPSILSIDAKIPGNHSINNIVCSCWFCNRMKHTMNYDDWIELLDFLKGNTDLLDYSTKNYVSVNESISKLHRFKPWYTLNHENKELFNVKNSNKSYFLELYKKQNEKDALFNLFPLVLFDRNNKLNVSCDKINCNDNTKYQLVPLFLNLAKNTLSNEQLLEEFKKRNFLQNKQNLQIILPEKYYTDSIFI